MVEKKLHSKNNVDQAATTFVSSPSPLGKLVPLPLLDLSAPLFPVRIPLSFKKWTLMISMKFLSLKPKPSLYPEYTYKCHSFVSSAQEMQDSSWNQTISCILHSLPLIIPANVALLHSVDCRRIEGSKAIAHLNCFTANLCTFSCINMSRFFAGSGSERLLPLLGLGSLIFKCLSLMNFKICIRDP